MTNIDSLTIWLAGTNRDITIDVDEDDNISLNFSSTSWCSEQDSTCKISMKQLFDLIDTFDMKLYDLLQSRIDKLEEENKSLKDKLAKVDDIRTAIKNFKL